jgi:hypothetical protein
MTRLWPLLLLCACAPAAEAPPPDLAAGGDLAMTAGSDLAGAVVGNEEGNLFPSLAWQGYVNDAADAISTTKPFVPYSTDAMKQSGRAYALVHVSDFI